MSSDFGGAGLSSPPPHVGPRAVLDASPLPDDISDVERDVRPGMWTVAGAVSGGILGAVFGGPAGAAFGAMVGGSGGIVRDATDKSILQHYRCSVLLPSHCLRERETPLQAQIADERYLPLISELTDAQKQALFGSGRVVEPSPAAGGGILSGGGFARDSAVPHALTNTELRSLNGEPITAGHDCTCKICMENKIQVVLQPCGHACCCGPCAAAMHRAGGRTMCPLCREQVGSIQRIYL